MTTLSVVLSTPPCALILDMEDPERLRKEYVRAVLQHQNDLADLTLHHLRVKRARQRKDKQMRISWVRLWVGRRRQFGMYDQLMGEQYTTENKAFSFMY